MDNQNQQLPQEQFQVEQPTSQLPTSKNFFSKYKKIIIIIVIIYLVLTTLGVVVVMLVSSTINSASIRMSKLSTNPYDFVPTISPTVSKPSPTTIPDETASWKTFVSKNGEFSISYPSEWITDTTYTPVRFKSSDLATDRQTNPIKGFTIDFQGKSYKPLSINKVFDTDTKWFGQNSKLQAWNDGSQSYLLLITKLDLEEFGMIMIASSDIIRDLNKDAFLKSAKSIKIKRKYQTSSGTQEYMIEGNQENPPKLY